MKACVLHGASDMRLESIAAEPLTDSSVRVRLGAAGICGSDQHYFTRGQMGAFAMREPFVLGHEMSGDVIELGAGVTDLALGDRVVIDPALNCGACPPCRSGRVNLCEDVRFMGSASRFPHLNGGFREQFVVERVRCLPVPAGSPHELIVFAEPLSVALHALRRAGNLFGARVMVAGAGTIGCLITAALRAAGAGRIYVSDPSPWRREVALRMGATSVLDPTDGTSVDLWDKAGGNFDAGFEASGHPGAFNDLVRSTTRGGKVVLVGMIPSSTCHVPFHLLTVREIDLVSTFRQNGVFQQAIDMLLGGAIDPTPILSAQFELDDFAAAFACSFERDKSLKVLLLGEPRAGD